MGPYTVLHRCRRSRFGFRGGQDGGRYRNGITERLRNNGADPRGVVECTRSAAQERHANRVVLLRVEDFADTGHLERLLRIGNAVGRGYGDDLVLCIEGTTVFVGRRVAFLDGRRAVPAISHDGDNDRLVPSALACSCLCT
jgi:hypothetical protein